MRAGPTQTIDIRAIVKKAQLGDGIRNEPNSDCVRKELDDQSALTDSYQAGHSSAHA